MPHVPDSLKETRHRRFLELLKKHRAKELAKILDQPENYISNVKSRRKAIGEELARDWEIRLGLPKYWLDGDDVSPRVAEPKQAYHGIYLTRSGAMLAAEWEKLDVDSRIEIEELILTRVAAQKRMQRRTPNRSNKSKTSDDPTNSPED